MLKNSPETLKKISQITNLEDEVILAAVKQDLKEFEMKNRKDQWIEQLLGKMQNVPEEEIIKKLVELYKKQPPYLGFCHIYWEIKKEILKEKYQIDWYTPSEENPSAIYD